MHGAVPGFTGRRFPGMAVSPLGGSGAVRRNWHRQAHTPLLVLGDFSSQLMVGVAPF